MKCIPLLIDHTQAVGGSKVVRQVPKTFTRYFHKTSLCEVRGTSPPRKSACSYTQRRQFDPSRRPGGSDWHQISYVILRGNFSARATLLSDHLFWGNFAWLQLAGSRGKKETRNSPEKAVGWFCFGITPFYPLQTVSIQLRQGWNRQTHWGRPLPPRLHNTTLITCVLSLAEQPALLTLYT